jgi:hypothetical protein
VKMSPTMQAFLKTVEARWRGTGQCWKCLGWTKDLREVEQRGWLCRDCRDKPIS